jgi:hypothetical protein
VLQQLGKVVQLLTNVLCFLPSAGLTQICNDFFLHVGQLPKDNDSEAPIKKLKTSAADDALTQAFGAINTQDADLYKGHDAPVASWNAMDDALAQAFGAINTKETELEDALTEAFDEIDALEEVDDGTYTAFAVRSLDTRPQSPLYHHQEQLELSESEVAELALWWESETDPFLDL